jgi:hypothetical protein
MQAVNDEPVSIPDHTRNMILELVRGVWTLCPGVITKVNSGMTVGVKIKIERIDNPYLELEDVPMVFPRGGTSMVLLPVAVGDVVLVGFSKFNLDTLITNTQVVQRDIDSEEYFNREYAIVLAGFVLANETNINWPVGQMMLTGRVGVEKELALQDLSADPTTPVDGMIWRNGTKIKVRVNGVTIELSSGSGSSPSGTVVSEIAFGQAPSAGVATAFSRGDHTHGTPAAPTIPVAATTVTTETSFGQASNAGTAATFSKGDHTHGTPAAPAGASPQETIRFVGTGEFIIDTRVDGAWIAPAACTISRVVADVKERGKNGGGVTSSIWDVNKNGVTIFTTQANRPTITATAGGGEAYAASGIPDIVSLAQNDRLTVDTDAVSDDAALLPSDFSIIIMVVYT